MLIVVCGGGGKTTFVKKYSKYFIDIDEFIWSDINKKYHKKLIEYCNNCLYDKISDIYKNIMINNKEFLKKQNKIILAHDPINAKWIETKCLCILKPSKKLHLLNIKDRDINLQYISINNWNNLQDAYIYNSYKELEDILLKYI